MENIFSVEDDVFPSDSFIIRKLDEEKIKQFEKLSDTADELQKKYSEPLWFKILKATFFYGGLICLIIMLAGKKTFEEKYAERGYLLYIGIALLVISAALYLYSYLKGKKNDNQPDVLKLSKNVDALIKEGLYELDVPENSKKIDVLMFEKKNLSNGKTKNYDRIYFNQERYFFIENDNLCLALPSEVVAIPVNSFIKIVKIKGTHFLLNWNKEEAFNSKEYKEFVKNGNYGLTIKYTYSVEYKIDDKEYNFLIPNYDLDAFLSVLKLDVIEGVKDENK